MNSKQVIVFGYGPYGAEVANALRNVYTDIVIFDQYERHLEQAKADGFTHLSRINVHHEDAFEALGIEANATVFCAFEDEAYNIYLTISLRAEYQNISIVAFGETKESHHKFMTAGADKVIIVEEAGANLLYNKLVNPVVSTIFEDIFYYKSDLNMGEVAISSQSKLVGSSLRALSIKNNHNIVVLGIVDLEFGNNFIFATTGHDHRLDPGDVLVLLGGTQEIERFREEYA